MQSSGEMSRESAKLCQPTTPHAVIAQLDRAIQYSRDRNESSETPRRTGFPAFAGNPVRVGETELPGKAVIARSSRQNCAAILRRSDEAIQNPSAERLWIASLRSQ